MTDPRGPYPTGQASDETAPKRDVLSVILVCVGAGVLLIGITLLVVLAIQSGNFGPVPRVVLGTVLGIASLLAAFWVHHKDARNIGADAFGGVGFGALLLSLAGATLIYNWWPAWVGVIVATILGGLACWLAHTWKSETLAVIGIVGAQVLLAFQGPSVLWGGVWTVALLLVTVPLIRLHPRWMVLNIARYQAPWVMTIVMSIDSSPTTRWVALLLATISVAVCVGQALWSPSHEAERPMSTIMLPWVAIGFGIVALTPTSNWKALLLAVVGGGLIAIAALPQRELKAFRVCTILMGSMILQGAVTTLSSDWTLVFIAVLTLAFIAWGYATRDVAPVAGALVGVALCTVAAFLLWAMTMSRAATDDFLIWQHVLGSALIIAVMFGAHYLVRALAPKHMKWLVYVLIVGAAFALMAAIVGLGTRIGSGEELGFRVGHAAATLSWLIIGGVLMFLGFKPQHPNSLRYVGLGFELASILKLLLFDMSRIDGIARVVLFILAGVALLVVGTIYARWSQQASDNQQSFAHATPYLPTGPQGPMPTSPQGPMASGPQGPMPTSPQGPMPTGHQPPAGPPPGNQPAPHQPGWHPSAYPAPQQWQQAAPGGMDQRPPVMPERPTSSATQTPTRPRQDPAQPGARPSDEDFFRRPAGD